MTGAAQSPLTELTLPKHFRNRRETTRSYGARMELNPRRPAHLHAGSIRPVRARPNSRASWRRHLHNEPPGLLRRLHGIPRSEAAPADEVSTTDGSE